MSFHINVQQKIMHLLVHSILLSGDNRCNLSYSAPATATGRTYNIDEQDSRNIDAKPSRKYSLCKSALHQCSVVDVSDKKYIPSA